MTEFYANKRFNLPNLHAELLHRNVLGSMVIDLERITGVAETALEIVAVSQVDDGLIQNIWFYYRNP